MSRRRRAENPVSLFPFVAVMASTMGALILLLLVTARQASKARDAAWLEEQRSAKPLPALPPLPGLVAFPELPPLPPHELPELVERVLPVLPPLTDPRSAILARRRQIEAELAELRKKRARTPKAGEERLAPLMREAALLRTRLEGILQERRAAQAKAKEAKTQADELAAEKERAAERRKLSPHQFAVTPYFGPNATSRRPIYLECTGDAIVLRPEGVSIPTAALDGDARADNPLARLVHAVADHWTRRDPEAPYPLLLVRPDGVHSYYVARNALEFLRYPFGYELVPAERELAFPKVDDQVKVLAEAALRASPRRAIANLPPRGVGGHETSRRGGHGRDEGEGVGDGQGGLASAAPHSPLAAAPNASPPRLPPGGGDLPHEVGNATGTGVVPAIVPAPDEPEESRAEIGASVHDYVARHQGSNGRGRGLGALSATAPTPFEHPPGGAASNDRGGRPRRERTQAKVNPADLERPRPTLSQRLQEMVQEAPIPLPASKPQTQRWQPGLEGMDRPPATPNGDGLSAPQGAWSAAPGGGGMPKPSIAGMGEGGSLADTPMPDGLGTPPYVATLGTQLANAANAQHPCIRGKDDPLSMSLGGVQLVDRAISYEVRASSVVLPTGETMALESDEDATAAAQAVARTCFAAVDQWSTPPEGKRWRPYVLLQVRSGAAGNAYRLRGLLAAGGISVKQAWVDDQGVPTLLPAWGR